MADKEIVPYVAPESRQGDPLSPTEQYFAEALQEEAFPVTVTSPAMPRSTPRRKDLRGARGRSVDHPGQPTSPRSVRLPASLVVLHHLVEYFQLRYGEENHGIGPQKRN